MLSRFPLASVPVSRRMSLNLVALMLCVGGTQLATGTMTVGAEPKKLVIVAGKPSHPPRMHEFNAGTKLLAKCLEGRNDLRVETVSNGWPENESVFEDAAAIVFYMDGGGNHELVKENGRRLKLAEGWASKGVGIGCMHYGVEVVAQQAGAEFRRLIGGHYEHMFSCNPIWEPEFAMFPEHAVTRGVQPFRIKDEWYFHMRFAGDLPGHSAATVEGTKFQPILVATPPDLVREGPYVYPRGPYPHIQANKGRAEAMMWVVERPDGGRGMGFTGGHFHDNWGNPEFRKVVLNSFLWLAGVEVPETGVFSEVAPSDLDAHLDPKPAPKK
jgi:type 1 glutamine amidotransferase